MHIRRGRAGAKLRQVNRRCEKLANGECTCCESTIDPESLRDETVAAETADESKARSPHPSRCFAAPCHHPEEGGCSAPGGYGATLDETSLTPPEATSKKFLSRIRAFGPGGLTPGVTCRRRYTHSVWTNRYR